MAIPPQVADAEAARPYFRRLRELRDAAGLEHLSMGMSADFAQAIEEGATMVRVGHRRSSALGGAWDRGRSAREHQGQAGRLPRLRQHGRSLDPRHAPGRARAQGGHPRLGCPPHRLAHVTGQYGIRGVASNRALVREADVIVLAVKPQVMGAVLGEVASIIEGGKLFISLAAGVAHRHPPCASGSARAPHPRHAQYAGPGAGGRRPPSRARRGSSRATWRRRRSCSGRWAASSLLDEDALDAVTGLSGSGPAYVAIVIESLADGGVKMGLDRATAMTLAAQTVLGSAKLILETGVHPGQLKDMVASPGGTTIAGIAALEEGGVRRTFIMRGRARDPALPRAGETTLTCSPTNSSTSSAGC